MLFRRIIIKKGVQSAEKAKCATLPRYSERIIRFYKCRNNSASYFLFLHSLSKIGVEVNPRCNA